MKVLFVINNYYAKGNGLSASARRTVEKLKEYGIDVKVLSGFNTESEVQPDFVLKHFNIPVFNDLLAGIIHDETTVFEQLRNLVAIENIYKEMVTNYEM